MHRLHIALLACLLCVAPQGALAQTLKIATLAPEGTTWMNEMQKGGQEIARRTGGRVQLRFFPGGVMGNDQSVLRKIRVDQLQGGAVTGSGLEQIFAESQIYSLPFAFRSYAEVDYVRQRMDPVLIDGLKQAGFTSFGLGEGGFAYILSQQPIGGVGDVKNRKVWIPEGDRVSRAIFEVIDAAPVPLPLTDVLTGLQTGLIDTVGAPPVGAIALQWHTRVKYLTDAPLFYTYGTLVIANKAFARLEPADQAVVEDVMGKVFATLNRQTRADNASAREALQRQGIQFIQPTPQELERWRQVAAEATRRLVESGVYSPALVKTLRGHLDDYRKRVSSAARP
ncbi:MAG: TRAP transporter substrate-binding protein DctP [Pseudomonadota bacterium]|nr:TRAP transporter substrate-binding protein DctP [Pseudomonadota bacterium]